MLQIQITQIDNGFLVGTPPTRNPITGSEEPPTVKFCKDKTDVLAIMNELWPAQEDANTPSLFR